MADLKSTAMVNDRNVPADTQLAQLAERAVIVFRTRGARLTGLDPEAMRQIRAGRRALCRQLRSAVRERDWCTALMLYGNASDAGFLFLESALPSMEPEMAAKSLLEGWSRGFFGEHALLDGA